MIVSMGDKNGMEISGLDIYTTETGATVKMNGLRVIGSSLRYERVMEKDLTVDDDSVETTGLGMSGLRITGSSLRCEKAMEKRSTIESTVDNDDVGTTELEISWLGVTGCNLRREGTTEKGSIVDNNGVGTTGIGMSGLGKTSSSFVTSVHNAVKALLKVHPLVFV